MKYADGNIKQKIYDGIPVYTKCSITVNHKDTGAAQTFNLEPTDFTVQDNSYTENGGFDLPIGKVISKSIKLSIDNTGDRFDGYDLTTGVIALKSLIYPDGLQATPIAFDEGIFYVSTVDIINYTVKLTAYDRISVLDTPYGISNYNPSTRKPIYSTLWDYFVHLCDDVYRELIGKPVPTGGTHWYSNNLANHFLNSDMPLDGIVGEGNPSTTLRDIFGYIAQLAGGVVVLDSLEKIDIKSPKLIYDTYINGMTFSDTVIDIYDGGEFDSGTLGYTVYYTLEFPATVNYALLDKFTSPPIVEYTDVKYTKVTISYPMMDSKQNGSASYGSSDYNVLNLVNPLCQRSDDNNARIREVAQNILIQTAFSITTMKPFSGTYTNNPLLEIMDSVIVVDSNGIAYNSFVGEHTMNYLGASEIANHTPTVGQNKRTYA